MRSITLVSPAAAAGRAGTSLPTKAETEAAWAANAIVEEHTKLLRVKMAGRAMIDKDMDAWCTWFERYFRSSFSGRGFSAQEINFSNNQLTSIGVQRLLGVLVANDIGVRVLKLFQNRIEKGAGISQYVLECKGCLRELHLSHNLLDTTAALEITVAATTARDAGEFVYPRRGTALWLRLEQNNIQSVEMLTQRFTQEVNKHGRSGRLLCHVDGETACTPYSCSCGTTPAIHTTYLKSQQRGGGPYRAPMTGTESAGPPSFSRKSAAINPAPTISRTVSGPPTMSKATTTNPTLLSAGKSRSWNVEAASKESTAADKSEMELSERSEELFPPLDAPSPSRHARAGGKLSGTIQDRATQENTNRFMMLGRVPKEEAQAEAAEKEEAPAGPPPPAPGSPPEPQARECEVSSPAAAAGEGEEAAAASKEEQFPPLGGAPTPARAPRASKKQLGKKAVASQDGAQHIHLAPTTDPKELEAVRAVVNPSEESVCVAPGRELPCPPPDFPPPMPPPGLELVSQTAECSSHVNLPMNDLSSSANGEEECRIGSVGAAEPEAVIGVRAIAKHTYVAEAPGYLNLAVGDIVEALMDAPEPGDEGCKWESYVFCSSKSGRHGWAPREALWRQYFDDDGRPWLFHEATGDWCWES